MRPNGYRRLLIAIFTLSTCHLHAQYFGQNKVRYNTQPFRVLKTEHFDIYHHDPDRAVAERAGQMAERWYARLSALLSWNLSSRQPLILYGSPAEFQATTVIPGAIGEATGGVTEALRRRIVLPLSGNLGETDHVIGHELVHAFQYDMAGAGAENELARVAALPLWFIEGMAEYLSLGPLDPNTAMWMRDAVQRQQLPTISKLDNPQYFPYRYGQALWAYIGGRFGDSAVAKILSAAVRSGDALGAIANELGISADELSRQWHAALSEQYQPILAKSTPASDNGTVLISPQHEGELHVAPALSPDGKRIAFLSSRGLFSVDLYLADASSGKVLGRITQTALDPHENSLEFTNSAGSWSADGARFAYGHVQAGRSLISVYDVRSGRTVRNIPVPVAALYTPAWSPDGKSIVFSGLAGGITDLFVLDLATGATRRLTNDAFADLEPAWSPDGNTIAFATDRFTSDLSAQSFGDFRIALLDLASGTIRKLPLFEQGKQINPQWSKDGSALWFVSDRDGIPNIYRVDLPQNRISQQTNLQTGASGITSLSPLLSVAADSGQLAYSAFFNRAYRIVMLSATQARAATPPATQFSYAQAAALPPRQRATGQLTTLLNSPRQGLVSQSQFQIHPYSPKLSLDYVAPPTVAVGVGNFGSLIAGGTALHFSDLLGYHELTTAFQTSVATSSSHILRNLAALAEYRNQRHRWTWGLTGGQVPVVTAAFFAAPASVGGEPALVENSVTQWQIQRQIGALAAYPFSRAQRLEFSLSYQNIAFALESRTTAISALSGQLLFDQVQELPVPNSLHLANSSAALVYDTSIFGGVSPVLGQSYRLEMGYSAGSLNFATGLADYRRYFTLARPLSLAGRFLHYGRYGGDADADILQPLFIGYPWLVRGYDANSFSAAECGPALQQSGRCPVFDQLLGSRIAVANAEARLQLVGPLGLARTFAFPPVELAPFYDTGVAWSSRQPLAANRFVSSYGLSLRFSLLGFAVAQISYVHPRNRPLEKWGWNFTFVPGF